MPAIDIQIIDPRLHDKEMAPAYATAGSAGFDLRACLDEPVTLAPGECKMIGSGFAISLGDPGLVAKIYPRSGLGHKSGVILGNGTGVIDSDYTGEVKISCLNRSAVPVTINPMDRIAQMTVEPVVRVTFNVVDELTATTRGAGGFGSTGHA